MVIQRTASTSGEDHQFPAVLDKGPGRGIFATGAAGREERPMTPIDYLTIQADILYRDDLNPTEKIILGLIQSFNSNGLMLSNEEIGKLASINGDHVTKILKGLRDKNLIFIENSQSRYRRIYSGKNNGVHSVMDSGVDDSTPAFRPVYSGKNNGQNINNINNTYTAFAFVLKSGESWKLTTGKIEQYRQTYPGIDVEKELRKAKQWLTDNPAKRKTAKGMPRFLNGWLSRTKPQGIDAQGGGHTPASSLTREATAEEAESLRKQMIAAGY
jgi:hypothetical protein